jgi:MtrB/PioB family decaheme-associated outer membrane protein
MLMTKRRLAVATALACGMVVSAMTPAARAADGDFTIGSQWWDQSSSEAKFQEFRQVPRGGFLESFLFRELQGRNTLSIWGANGLRTDQATKATWTNGARWRADASYTEIPHLFSRSARWGWTQTGPGAFTIPDTLQARNQGIPSSFTTRMQDFTRNAPVIGRGFNTDITNVRLRARPARAWQFEAKATNRQRSGLKPYGLDFGFNTVLENPEPIDQRMSDADFTATYQKNGLRAQASAGLSQFRNHISTLSVDNPKVINDDTSNGPRVGKLDLYPDNDVVRGSLALAYLMPRRTALAVTFGMAQGKQDDSFLPFTNNSTLPQRLLDSLPARSLNAKATSTNGDVRLTSSPLQNLDGTVRVHYAKYDNQTEELNFIGQSPYEVSWQRFIEMKNHVADFTQMQSGVDADYAVNSRIRVGGTVEYRIRERTEREVEKDKETVLGGRARVRLADGMQLSGKYTRGDRKLDAFDLQEYFGLQQGTTSGLFDTRGQLEPSQLRRFDVANRVEDNAVASLAYAFSERLDLGGTYNYVKDDYKDTSLGLQDETMHMVSSSATLHVNDQLDLDGGYGYTLSESNQQSRSSPATISTQPESLWTARLKNTDVFVFLGFDWLPTRRFSMGADYQISRNLATYDLDNGLHNALDLPATFYRLSSVTVDARWKWVERTTLIARFGWEEYDVSDWAVQGLPLVFPLTGTASTIFLGDNSQNYVARRVAFLVSHHF